MVSMEVISSDSLTDQMVANTSCTLWWPRMNQRDGCWLDPQVPVMPDLRSPGQLLSVHVPGCLLYQEDFIGKTKVFRTSILDILKD